MKTSIALFATSLLATVVQAQQTYTINPNNVPLSLREYWCSNQKTQCPLICLQTSAHSSETRQNNCDPTLLTYACVCSNGLSPNLTQYSQTLPFYTCQEWGNECVHNCGNDATCASACRQDHPCGAQSPVPPNSSTMTTTMQSTKTGLPGGATTNGAGQTVFSGFAGGSSASPTSGGGSGNGNGAGAVRVPFLMEYGHGLGMVAIVGGFLIGFAAVL